MDATSYQRDGYLIVPDLLGADDCAALLAESVALSRGQLGAMKGLVESPESEIALEDARIENGCLRVFPGSHRPSVLWPMREHHNPELDRAEEIHGYPHQPSDAVAIEIAAGSAIFFDGYLIHGSYPNQTTGRTRRSLLYVYASAHTPVMFNPAHYQPTAEDYPDILMVSGRDSHPWAKRERCGEPYLRPAGPTVADLQLAQRQAHR